MHAVVRAGVGAPYGAAEEFAGCIGIPSDGAEEIHLDAEVEAAVDVSGKEEIDIVFLVCADESALVGDGGEGGSGIEVPLLLRGNDIGSEGPGEGIVDGKAAIIDDAALYG